MARTNIDSYLENILKAVYGEEVRGSIHDAIAELRDLVEQDVTLVDPTLSLTGTAADAKVVGDTALIHRGALPSDDLNDIDTCGIYRMTSTRTYINSPLRTSTGWLIVYQYGDGGRSLTQQVIETGTNSNKTYAMYLRSASTSATPYTWGEWQSSLFDIDTTLSVAGAAADAKTVGDRLSDLEYFPIEIEEFTISPSKAEYGDVITTATYHYTLNKEPASVNLDTMGLDPDKEGSGELNGLNVRSKTTWTLKVKDSGSGGSIQPVKDTMGAAINFMGRVFWGSAPDPGEANVDSEFIEAFRETGSALSKKKGRDINVIAVDDEYIWYALPSDYGIPEFTYGGFSGGFRLYKIMEFTNKFSHTETYYIYRSVQPCLGNVTVTIL